MEWLSRLVYLVAIQVLILGYVAAGEARDLYVDNVAGDDRFDAAAAVSSGSESGPCRTIAKALRVANKGDRIVLTATGQPYRECITLQGGRHSGLADRPFEIAGNGAVLEGAAPVPRRAWKHVSGDVYRFSPPRKSYQLLFLAGKPANRVAPSPDTGAMPEMKPLEWSLFERHVYFCCESGRIPTSYELSYTHHPVGITLYEVRNIVVRDLTIQGFQLDGISAHDSVFDASLVGLTCRGNARSGISVGGASRVRITDCLLGNNGAAQLRTEGHSHTYLKNCDLLDNSAPSLAHEGGVVHGLAQPRE